MPIDELEIIKSLLKDTIQIVQDLTASNKNLLKIISDHETKLLFLEKAVKAKNNG